jgi:hypothetical protein
MVSINVFGLAFVVAVFILFRIILFPAAKVIIKNENENENENFFRMGTKNPEENLPDCLFFNR